MQKNAMDKEINSSRDCQTWDLVKKPNGPKVIKRGCVFVLKDNDDGTRRWKARLVIKGYLQSEGIYYFETFSPVVRFIRLEFFLS